MPAGSVALLAGETLAAESGIAPRPATLEWDVYGPRMRTIHAAEPGPGHLAARRLQDGGWLRGVVTDADDVLLDEAGVRDVVSLAGSVELSVCPRCTYNEPLGCLLELLPRPRCAACGGPLVPDVVPAGEEAPADAVSRAREVVADAGVLLLAGHGALAALCEGRAGDTIVVGDDRPGARAARRRRSPPGLWSAAMSSTWSDDDGAPERSLRVGRVAAPLRSQALEVVRSAILDFHYEPGRRLFERELMEDLGVSRTTIREVLRELGAEGLVESLPQGGVIVVTPSVKQAREVYEVRAALEALAVRYFAERATDAQVVALRDALAVFERAAGDGGDFLALLRSKEEAYDIVLAGAGNGSVEAIQKGLRARVRALDAASLARPGRPVAELAELRLIVQAIERRDPDGAAQATADHVALASQAGLATLSGGAAGLDIVPKDGDPTV